MVGYAADIPRLAGFKLLRRHLNPLGFYSPPLAAIKEKLFFKGYPIRLRRGNLFLLDTLSQKRFN